MITTTELIKEMEQESKTTRKMLARVPEDYFGWQPHPKSMTLGRLAAHVAELPGWVTMTFNTSELDLGKTGEYTPQVVHSAEELMAYFEEQLNGGLKTLDGASEDELVKDWSLLQDGHLISTQSKAEVIRMAYCQIVHHRAQLGVFLRLLEVPIPGSYGPSADEVNF
jgi:uncharacterized damage-inducible protein DinB